MSVLSLGEVGERWHSGLGENTEKYYSEEYVEKLEEQIEHIRKLLIETLQQASDYEDKKEKQIVDLQQLLKDVNEKCKYKKQITAVQKILEEFPAPNTQHIWTNPPQKTVTFPSYEELGKWLLRLHEASQK